MKKNYISPETEMAIVELSKMIAASLVINNQEGDAQIENEDEFLARRHNNVWDEEEEEEQY